MQVFPLKALHEAALAKIADLLEQDQIAGDALSRAIQQLKITGPDSPVLYEMLQLYQERRRREGI